MKRILAAILIGLFFCAPAVAQKSKAAMTSEISSNLPTGCSGCITPTVMRTTLTDMVNSWQQYAFVNAQTGTTYTIAGSDYGQMVTFTNAAAVAVTLPQAAGSFQYFNFYASNLGAGTVTITPQGGSTINGAASFALTQNQNIWIVSDGANYQIFRGASVQALTCSTHQWINAISSAGLPSCAQPAFTDISGTLGSAQAVGAYAGITAIYNFVGTGSGSALNYGIGGGGADIGNYGFQPTLTLYGASQRSVLEFATNQTDAAGNTIGSVTFANNQNTAGGASKLSFIIQSNTRSYSGGGANNRSADLTFTAYQPNITAFTQVMTIGSTDGVGTILWDTEGPHGINTDQNPDVMVYVAGTSTKATGSTFGAAEIMRLATTVTVPANKEARGLVVAPNFATGGSGTIANMASLFVAPPNVSSGTATITNAASLIITDAPSSGTNKYAAWVKSGTTKLDGGLTLGSITGSTQCLHVNSSGVVSGTGSDCGGGGGSGITIGTTTITSGTTTRVLFDNAGVVGEYVITGTGNVVMSASPTLTGTITAAIANFSGALTSAADTITSASANALAVGLNGTTNPALQIDASTGSSATGIKIKSAAAAGGVAVSVITSGTNENLAIDAAGSGTITFGGTSTGAIVHTRATTLSAALTYGGVTLSNAVTGTGKMVLDTSPTIASLTVTGAFTATGLVTNADLANASTTVNGIACTLGSTCTAPVQVANSFSFNIDGHLWGQGATTAPSSWTLAGASGTVAQNAVAAQVRAVISGANVTRSGTDVSLSQNVMAIPKWSSAASWGSQVVTYGRWVYATVASRARIAVYDGSTRTFSSYHSGGSSPEFLTVTKTLQATPTQVNIENWVDTGNTSATFSGGAFVVASVLPNVVAAPTEWIGGKAPAWFTTTATAFPSNSTHAVFIGIDPAGTPVTFAGVLSALTMNAAAAPGAAQTFTFTNRKNASSGSLTCQMSGGSATTCNDTSHQAYYSKDDIMDLLVVSSAAANAEQMSGSATFEEIPISP